MAVTQKISVTIGRRELGHAKRLASKLGVSLAQTIDALVMASACRRPNEIVYTSDVADLEALRAGVPQFASVRIERA